MSKNTKTNQIYSYVTRKLDSLHEIAETGVGKGILATLRRGVGKNPGELPELWGLIFDGIPEELFGKDGFAASKAEWSIYTVLTLFALHQQGNEKWMNVKDVSLGKAAGLLVKSLAQNADFDIAQKHIQQRMNLIATAKSQEDLAYYLRSLIRFFSNNEIGLDYARLAKELYLMSFDENLETVEAVKMTWGRNFFAENYSVNKDKNKNEDEEKEI